MTKINNNKVVLSFTFFKLAEFRFVSVIWYSDFGFVLHFVLRISDLMCKCL